MTAGVVRRPGTWAVAAVPVAALVLLAVPHAPLTRATSFRVSSPSDGALVKGSTVVAWTPAPGASRYAVVVDGAPPAPGQVPSPSVRVRVVAGRQVVVSLGPASSGSPSARHFHTLRVVPLDAAGRRLGEDVAVVHLRGQP